MMVKSLGGKIQFFTRQIKCREFGLLHKLCQNVDITGRLIQWMSICEIAISIIVLKIICQVYLTLQNNRFMFLFECKRFTNTQFLVDYIMRLISLTNLADNNNFFSMDLRLQF